MKKVIANIIHFQCRNCGSFYRSFSWTFGQYFAHLWCFMEEEVSPVSLTRILKLSSSLQMVLNALASFSSVSLDSSLHHLHPSLCCSSQPLEVDGHHPRVGGHLHHVLLGQGLSDVHCFCPLNWHLFFRFMNFFVLFGHCLITMTSNLASYIPMVLMFTLTSNLSTLHSGWMKGRSWRRGRLVWTNLMIWTEWVLV